MYQSKTVDFETINHESCGLSYRLAITTLRSTGLIQARTRCMHHGVHHNGIGTYFVISLFLSRYESALLD